MLVNDRHVSNDAQANTQTHITTRHEAKYSQPASNRR